MKKKNFFGGLYASLALATLGLTTVTLTSCEKESFNVSATTGTTTTTPNVTTQVVDLPDAKAIVSITVIDWSNGTVLATKTESVTPGTEVTISCPDFTGKANYADVDDIKVSVPSLEKGQTIVIPVSFYVQSLESIAASGKGVVVEVAGAEAKSSNETEDVEIADDVKLSSVDRTDVVIDNVITKAGQEIVNLSEVYAYIDALFPETKAAYSNDQKKTILKAYVNTDNTGIKDVAQSIKIDSVPANNEISVEVVTEYLTEEKLLVYNFSDEEAYSIPITLKSVVSSKPVVTLKDLSHSGDNSHDGHDGHGDSTNAGGGTAGK
jgi:hypothetical protein